MAMALITWGFEQGVELGGGTLLAPSLSVGLVVCVGGGFHEGLLRGTNFG